MSTVHTSPSGEATHDVAAPDTTVAPAVVARRTMAATGSASTSSWSMPRVIASSVWFGVSTARPSRWPSPSGWAVR